MDEVVAQIHRVVGAPTSPHYRKPPKWVDSPVLRSGRPYFLTPM